MEGREGPSHGEWQDMCNDVQTRWGHGVTNDELDRLAGLVATRRSAPAAQRLLAGIKRAFAEDGLRPPVSVVAILVEQMEATALGRRSEFGDRMHPGIHALGFAAYRYHREDGREVEAFERFSTKLQRAIHKDAPMMTMSFRLMDRLNAILLDAAGKQVVMSHCCAIFQVPVSMVRDVLASRTLEDVENARARGGPTLTDIDVSCPRHVPRDVVEMGDNDRVLHAGVERVMAALCGPIEHAHERLSALRLVAAA